MSARAACRLAGVIIGILLAACQPLPHPFANDVPKPGSPMLALRDTRHRRDCTARWRTARHRRKAGAGDGRGAAKARHRRQRPRRGDCQLSARRAATGDASLRRQNGDRRVVGFARSLRQIARARAERIEAAADDWQQGKDDAVARLAAASADQIAAMLQDKAPVEAAEQGKLRLSIRHAEGAPGDGGTALASAITTLLKRQDLAIVSDSQDKTDLVLDATVTVDKPIAGKQHVKIVWHVRHGDGSEIGTVAQENDVPEGMLDGPWGDVAFTIAVAAQDGIMQLIARGVPQSAGNS